MKVTYLPRLRMAAALLLSATACEKNLLDQVNPNLPTVESSWQTSDDAVRASVACYAGLQGLGMYRRWLNFAFDLRDDTSWSQSPWGELAARLTPCTARPTGLTTSPSTPASSSSSLTSSRRSVNAPSC